MTGLRVLVCGGREFDNWTAVTRTLSAIHAETPIGCIIEGGARGADFLAQKWARHNNIASMRFEAHWNTMGKRAGHVRNGWMLEYGQPDLVIAFPGAKGTQNMVEQAARAGVEVRRPGSAPESAAA